MIIHGITIAVLGFYIDIVHGEILAGENIGKQANPNHLQGKLLANEYKYNQLQNDVTVV